MTIVIMIIGSPNGTSTSVTLSMLSNSTTYYWHVRAWNGSAGPTYSNGSDKAFWNFRTVPAGFTKICPPNLVIGQPRDITLCWGPYTKDKVKQYQICIDPDTNTKCNSGWRKKIMSTSYTTTLRANTTYCCKCAPRRQQVLLCGQLKGRKPGGVSRQDLEVITSIKQIFSKCFYPRLPPPPEAVSFHMTCMMKSYAFQAY